jgi:hypothetical protein
MDALGEALRRAPKWLKSSLERLSEKGSEQRSEGAIGHYEEPRNRSKEPFSALWRAELQASPRLFGQSLEGVFCEVGLPRYGVLRSWLRGSAGGIMLVVEGDIPLWLKRKVACR